MNDTPTQRRPTVMVLLTLFAIAATIVIMAVAVQTFELLGVPGVVRYGDEIDEYDDLPHDPLAMEVGGGEIYLTSESEGGFTVFSAGYLGDEVRVPVIARDGDTARSLAERHGLDLDDYWDDVDDPDAPLRHDEPLWFREPITYDREDFGTHDDRIGDRFVAASGYRVAAITDDQAIYFQTHTWYPLPGATGPQWVAIAMHPDTEQDTIWIADTEGHLRQFLVNRANPAATEAVDIELSEVDPDYQPSGHPALAVLDDGTLFFIDGALYVDWSRLQAPSAIGDIGQARLLGATADNVWFELDRQLVMLVDNQGEWDWHAWELDAGPLLEVRETVVSGDEDGHIYHRWLLTEDAALRNAVSDRDDRGDWQEMYRLEARARDFAPISRRPEDIWVIRDGAKPIFGESAWIFIIGTALLLGYGLLVVATLIGDRFRKPVKVVVPDKNPEPDISILTRLIELSPLAMIGLLAFVALFLWGHDALPTLDDASEVPNEIIEEIWPDAPEVVKEVVTGLLFALVFLLLMVPVGLVMLAIFPQLRQRFDPLEVIGGALLLIFFTVLEALMQYSADEDLTMYCIGGVVVGMIVLMVVLVVVLGGSRLFGGEGGLSINARLRRGRYDEVLGLVEGRQGKLMASTGPHLDAMIGSVLMLAGRFEEAEERLSQTVLATQASTLLRNVMTFNPTENLGAVRLMMGRYDEARTTLESALELKKTMWAGTRLAETYLFQDRQPEEALQALSRAARMLVRSEVQLPAEIEADRAWALALLGRYDEARDALAAAWEKLPDPFVHAEAGLHWRAGNVYRVLRQRDKAREHFQKSLEVEAAGYYAEAARRDLAALGG